MAWTKLLTSDDYRGCIVAFSLLENATLMRKNRYAIDEKKITKDEKKITTMSIIMLINVIDKGR